MSNLLKKAAADGYAVPSFCVWNAETAIAVVGVAADLRAPVILMNGPGEFCSLGPVDLAGIVREVSGRFAVPAALHLDHGDTIDLVEECLRAGYTSVMLDFSTRPYAENVAAMRQVVALARPCGVTVEGELGHVGQADTMTPEGDGNSILTDPAEAGRFVRETGVDWLSVAVGSIHGAISGALRSKKKVRARLNIEHLDRIRQVAGVPLVLHGGSGIRKEYILEGIRHGIAKINIGTTIRQAYEGASGSSVSAGQDAARLAVLRVIREELEAEGSAAAINPDAAPGPRR